MNYFNRLKKGKNNESSEAAPPPRGSSSKPRIVMDILPPETGNEEIEIILPIHRIAANKPETKASELIKPEPANEKYPPPKKPTAGLPPYPAPLPIPALPVPRISETVEPSKLEKPPAEMIIERELPVRTWEPEIEKKKRIWRKLTVWGLIAAVAAVIILPITFFSGFSVTIIPKVRTISVSGMDFSADTDTTAVDMPAHKVPAIAVVLEKTAEQDYDATGKKYIEEKAQGKVLIFNAFSSSPQALIANTRFQDASGRIFRLPSAILIPGTKVVEGKIVPSSIQATLVADAVGEEYNIGPAELRISNFRGTPKYEAFHAKAENGFSGGFKGEARVVETDDLRRASEDLTKRVFDQLKSDLQNKVPSGPDFIVPEGAREITITGIQQPNAGDRQSRFRVSVSARGRLMAVRRSHINQIIAENLLPKESELPAKFPGSQEKLVVASAKLETDGKTMTFSATGDFIYWREGKIGDFVQTLKTSTPEKAEIYLRNREEIDSFRIKKFPAWLWFIPQREGAFTVKIQPPI